MKTNLISAMIEFLKSNKFREYARHFQSAARHAKERSGIDPYTDFVGWSEGAPDAAKMAHKLGSYFQYFWEGLPDNPQIRSDRERLTVFNQICDFAEEFVYGEPGNQLPVKNRNDHGKDGLHERD